MKDRDFLVIAIDDKGNAFGRPWRVPIKPDDQADPETGELLDDMGLKTLALHRAQGKNPGDGRINRVLIAELHFENDEAPSIVPAHAPAPYWGDPDEWIEMGAG